MFKFNTISIFCLHAFASHIKYSVPTFIFLSLLKRVSLAARLHLYYTIFSLSIN